jgi:Flp pilus assembly protein TadD
VVDDQNDNRVQLAGMALLRTGETERANYLLDQALAYYEGLPRAGAGPVFIYAFRGDKENAIAALRKAAKSPDSHI